MLLHTNGITSESCNLTSTNEQYSHEQHKTDQLERKLKLFTRLGEILNPQIIRLTASKQYGFNLIL